MLYLARCILETTTPLHCGGGEDDGLLDAPVTRDAYGLWRIPGSSIAGILRAHLHNTCGAEAERALFGFAEGNGGNASLLWSSDAVLLDYDNQPAWHKYHEGTAPHITTPCFLRDHVRIDDETQAASNTGKFDEEYVPAGVRFAFELALDGWYTALPPEAVAHFGTLLHALRAGLVSLGGHGSNGYGEFSMRALECRHFDLCHPGHMEQWLALPSFAVITTPLFPSGAGEEWQIPETTSTTPHGKGISGSLCLPLKAIGPLLIAGGRPQGTIDADMCFASTSVYQYEKKTSKAIYAIPGSSLRGVIRHRVLHILHALKFGEPSAVLDAMFGKADKQRGTQKGLLRVADAPLLLGVDTYGDAQSCETVQHVAVDRFTGGAMDAHLFNEAPVWRDNVRLTLRIRLDGLEPVHAGLLLHALLDIAQGAVAVGGGGNRGNGRLCLDRDANITCDLVWDGTRLTITDNAQPNMDSVRQWLERLQAALKENCHVA